MSRQFSCTPLQPALPLQSPRGVSLVLRKPLALGLTSR